MRVFNIYSIFKYSSIPLKEVNTSSPVIFNLFVLTWPISISRHLTPIAWDTSLSWIVSPTNKIFSGSRREVFNQLIPDSILPSAFSFSTPISWLNKWSILWWLTQLTKESCFPAESIDCVIPDSLIFLSTNSASSCRLQSLNRLI